MPLSKTIDKTSIIILIASNQISVEATPLVICGWSVHVVLTTEMSVLVILLGAAALLLSSCQAQDSHQISEIWQREAQLEALTQYPNLRVREEVMNAMASLEDLWTVYLPELVESMPNHTISDACINSTMAIIFGSTLLLPNITMPDIVPLLDATGKQGAGLLDGNLILDAAFDECFEYSYTGYCMGQVNLSFIPPSIPFSWNAGLCVPKHCSSSDVAAVMNSTDIFKVNENAMKCTDTKTPAYSPGAIVMVVVCVIFGILVVVGTILDRVLECMTYSPGETTYMAINSGSAAVSGSDEKVPLLMQAKTAKRHPGQCKVKWHEFITAFSLYKTVPTVLATKQAPSVITSLNGLRVISMFWVILGHTFGLLAPYADNILRMKTLIERFSFQPVENAFFAVDSFFFLSGVLVAYLSLRQMKKRKGRFPILHYYIHRYLRLTPTYAFVLFFAWFLTKHIAAAPSITLVDPYGPACAKYWWTNLLYINNLYPWNMKDQCIDWAWYLANDMQFFVISPLILIPAYFLLPVGLVISSTLLLCSFIVTATLVGVFDFQASIYANIAYKYHSNTTLSTFDLVYEKPWARIQPYIVGLALGYVLYRGVFPRFSRIINISLYTVMWAVSAVLLASTVYGLYPIWYGHIPSTAENVLYTTFSRFAWGIGLALMVFACHTGYGGVINSFLSMKIWTPLARMTYNAYLVHPVVLTVLYAQMQKSIHVTDLTMAILAVAFVVLSYAIGGVVCLVVEFPLGSVELLLFKMVGLEYRESLRRSDDKGKVLTEDVKA